MTAEKPAATRYFAPAAKFSAALKNRASVRTTSDWLLEQSPRCEREQHGEDEGEGQQPVGMPCAPLGQQGSQQQP